MDRSVESSHGFSVEPTIEDENVYYTSAESTKQAVKSELGFRTIK